MLVLLAGAWRKQAATLLIAFYALCLIVPGAAFALGDGSMPLAHCFSDHHHGSVESHHHEGMNHNKPKMGGDERQQSSPNNCCGLFSVSAIAPVFDVVTLPADQLLDVVIPTADNLFGRNSGRIDRPPRFLSSL
jgi:hypothetical protein